MLLKKSSKKQLNYIKLQNFTELSYIELGYLTGFYGWGIGFFGLTPKSLQNGLKTTKNGVLFVSPIFTISVRVIIRGCAVRVGVGFIW